MMPLNSGNLWPGSLDSSMFAYWPMLDSTWQPEPHIAFIPTSESAMPDDSVGSSHPWYIHLSSESTSATTLDQPLQRCTPIFTNVSTPPFPPEPYPPEFFSQTELYHRYARSTPPLALCTDFSLISPYPQPKASFTDAKDSTTLYHQDPLALPTCSLGSTLLVDTPTSSSLASLPVRAAHLPQSTALPLLRHEKAIISTEMIIPPLKEPVPPPKKDIQKKSSYSHDHYLRQASSINLFSLLTRSIKCPYPNCAKVYKNHAGLQWHLERGICNPQPAKILQLAKKLIEQKKEERRFEPADATEMARLKLQVKNGFASMRAEVALEHGLTEDDVREIERKLTEQGRPWSCGVGTCKRRYKELNGLRLHWRKSGEHGNIGLELFNSGRHSGTNQMREDGWDV